MYTGGWVQGQRHGHGELYYDPQTCYVGEWRHNRRHGRGRMTYRSGNAYDGAWADDERTGAGTMVWADRHESYTGDFVNGQMVRALCVAGGGGGPAHRPAFVGALGPAWPRRVRLRAGAHDGHAVPRAQPLCRRL